MSYLNKLSIIIPTRNRQIYAYKCIETILKFNRDDFEVVVHDNSDDDSLKTLLGELIENPLLKYRYDNSCLSFCDNFEKALEMSCGDYVVYIGDDDCVLEEIIDLVNIIRTKKIYAVSYATSISYFWPNSIKTRSGELVIRKKNIYCKKKSTKEALKKMKRVGNYDYQNYDFPKAYHGIVNREKLDNIKKKTGRYFSGLTPDIYCAVSLSFYVDEILYINYPFSIMGICPRSGSADSMSGKHTGELSQAPHFRGNDMYKWHESIPYIYTVDTIWAETAFKAVEQNGNNIQLTKKEYYKFINNIVYRYPMFKDRMIELYKENVGNKKNLKLRFFVSTKLLSLNLKIKKLINYASQLIHGRITYNNVTDIEEVIKIVRNKNNKFNKVVEKIKKME